MKIIAASYPGIEDVAIKEVREIVGSKASKVKNGRVAFDCQNVEGFLKDARSIDFVYRLVGNFKFKSLDDMKNKAGKLDFSFIKRDFVVRCKRRGEHDFSSIDIERSIGDSIFKQGHIVDLKSGNVIIADVVDNDCFIGVLLRDEMHKRNYRIRINKQGINACLAYSLLRIIGWEKKNSLLDPNCKDAVILIEAGLAGGNKLYGIESSKNNYISADINAKMANVKINLFNENISKIDSIVSSVDYVVSYLPSESKSVSKNFINRLYSDFFTNVRKIVKKKALVLLQDDSLLKDHLSGFKIIEKRVISAGNDYIAYILE